MNTEKPPLPDRKPTRSTPVADGLIRIWKPPEQFILAPRSVLDLRWTATVLGRPVPQGSKRQGRARGSGKPIILDVHPGLDVWREACRLLMRAARMPKEYIPLPKWVSITHYQPHPLRHYHPASRELRPNLPPYPISGLDLDKLARATGDSGSREWWQDDRYICWEKISREWCDTSQGERERLEVTCRIRGS